MRFSSRYPSTFLPLKLAKFDPVSSRHAPLAVRAERCQPIQGVEVGLQFDCPNAGCANESPTAALAAIAIGVLIMRWLQVSIEFRPSVPETRLISCGRLGISPLWNRKRQDPFFCRGMSAMLTLDPSSVT